MRLRWGIVAFELLVVVLAAGLFDVAMPAMAVVGCLAVAAASNAVLGAWLRRGGRASERLCGLVLAFDIVLFTGILHLAGGPWNPFSILYLLYITLAAVVLGPRGSAVPPPSRLDRSRRWRAHGRALARRADRPP